MVQKTAPTTTPTTHQKRLFKEFMGHAQAVLKIILELRDIEEAQQQFQLRKFATSNTKRRTKS